MPDDMVSSKSTTHKNDNEIQTSLFLSSSNADFAS